ncbi:MAG TPA: hypothetical protein VJB66_03495 [Candidatus Nanoarchaeia archaeon]|nr:hypothetical protein [Candidatus Nanoarchaeia archaeon]
MSFLDKILRRKNDIAFEKPSYKPLTAEDLGLGEIDNPSAGDPRESEDFSPSISPMRTFQQPSLQERQERQERQSFSSSQSNSRDMELVLSKLDTISSLLKNLDLRIGRLEKAAGIEEKHDKYRW